jgi:hypothetical protein
MLDWLIPIALFWTMAALYLGGMNVDVEGGSGPRQVLGLVLTFVLFLVVWGVLHTVLGGIGAVLWGVIVPTALTILALPLIARIGFRVVGVRLRRVDAH